ncbi:MAG TPA: ATP-grasp domain-containing protein [Kouleothrix sp.]|nr:ATP-grasp domain-containing protein [Kouleothrix sp.]
METQRILLLTTANSYRNPAFLAAAARLGVAVITAIDMPAALASSSTTQLGLDFADPARATAAIVAFAAQQPLRAIIAVDDSGSQLAAAASAALGLQHNDPAAAEAARDKYVMRAALARHGVPVPDFRLCSTGDDLAALAEQIAYPCVVKPLRLNGSRGVMRADDPAEFVAAARRLAALLETTEPQPGPKPFLVEQFIPGFEVALEGLLDQGALRVLALFDKPDPLDGPFFEETIYVTPSRLPAEVQTVIAQCAAHAAEAIGLRIGPMHAELRINRHGPWIVELAGRSIGGLCSQTLRFGTDASLEELIIRQACGLPIESLSRVGSAGGVMMIPIPGAGMLRNVSGVEAARAIPGIEDVEITAPLNNPIVPLPEGESYLGFIFARGARPAAVERALREAYAQLQFEIVPTIPLALG